MEISTKDISGWVVASEGKTTVALDLTITEELKAEGIAREFINRVQNLRKDKDFDLTDKILVQIEENSPFINEILKNQDYICAEVLAEKIEVISSLENAEEIEIEENKFKINIQKY